MRQFRTHTNSFLKEGEVWKEKTSNAYISLGHKENGLIPLFFVEVVESKDQIVYKKRDFWTNAQPSAIVKYFIKIV